MFQVLHELNLLSGQVLRWPGFCIRFLDGHWPRVKFRLCLRSIHDILNLLYNSVESFSEVKYGGLCVERRRQERGNPEW